jgi:hypothetical protein
MAAAENPKKEQKPKAEKPAKVQKPKVEKPAKEQKPKPVKVAPAADETTAVTFTHKDKKFRVLIGLVRIPGVNDVEPMTALEIADSVEAQKYLVANCVGSVIAEVVE